MKRFLSFLFLTALFLSLLGCTDTETYTMPEFRDLVWAVNCREPVALDFIEPDTLDERCVATFDNALTFDHLGTYEVNLTVKLGKNTYTSSRKLTLVEDTTPPVILTNHDISVCIGDGVSYKEAVTYTDNCDNGVTLTWDSSDVDMHTEGTYAVHYIATDASGNVGTLDVPVYVYQSAITEEMLDEKIDGLLDELGLRTISDKTTLCKKIYDYVHTLTYTATSDKGDEIRAAYLGITLQEGDCFTYFALSKALLNAVGIETVNVERNAEIAKTANEKHFWCLANIGTSEEPKWYHFDACRLKNQTLEGWLLTDQQLLLIQADRVSANGTENYFYVFDDTGLPERETEVVHN